MKRHTLLLLLPAALLLLSLPASAADKKPNVLFIAVDDLNDWISPLGGYQGVQTPNLDRLARRTTTFTRAYCAAPACNPSRAALLTGIRPSTSGVYHNPQPWRPAMPDAVTLPQHFMQNGYRVLGGGKIFHGAYKDPASWHEYFNRPNDPAPKKRPVNGIPNTAHFDWGPVSEDDSTMADTKVVDWAIEQLNQPREQPLFLAVGLFRPHLPWYVPQKYFDKYPLSEIVLPKVPDDDLKDVPPAGVKIARPEGDHKHVIEHDQWKQAVQGYLAGITFADTCLGRLLDALDKSPYADNTVVVLWGDHGWHLGEKQHWRKFALWEEAARVPLFISVPGVTKAGSRCERTVNLLDLYPTLAEGCGLPARKELEGVSLLPLLKDPEAAWDRPSLTTHGRNHHALRSEQWRYIRYADGSEELYDHDADPMEWTNLADRTEYSDVKAQFARWLPKVNAEDAPSQGKGKAKKAGQKKAAE